MTREKLIIRMVVANSEAYATIKAIENRIKNTSLLGDFREDITDLFDFKNDRKIMELVKSYFSVRGFIANINFHSNKDYESFTIEW